MEISALKRDTAAIKAGEWIGDIPHMGDVRLRVRGLTSPLYIAARAKRERAVPRSDRERDGGLKPEAAVRVHGEALADAVLLDWDGITDQGEPVPFDADLARHWLTDPDFMPFADAVTYAAQVVDRMKTGAAEDVAKN